MGRYRIIKAIIPGTILLIVLSIICAEPTPEMVWATCALVSSATPSMNTVGNTTVSFSATAGNTITIGLLMSNFGAAGPLIHDNLATYTPDAVSTKDVTNASDVYRYHRFNIGAGVTTITILNGSANGTADVLEFSGGSNVVDVKQPNGGATGAKGTWSPALSGTLAQAAELVIADAGSVGGTRTISSGPTNSYVEIGSSAIKLNGTGTLVSATLITNATTSTNTAWTMSATTPYSAILDTFECTTAAAATPAISGFFIPLEDRLGFPPVGLVPIVDHYE